MANELNCDKRKNKGNNIRELYKKKKIYTQLNSIAVKYDIRWNPADNFILSMTHQTASSEFLLNIHRYFRKLELFSMESNYWDFTEQCVPQ